jgi:hypothetical protein
MSEARRLYMVRDGIVRETIFDASEGRLVIHTAQDLEPILDGIARDRETMRHGTNKKLATLPAIVVEDLIKRGIYDDPDAFDAWLNSSECDLWRVWKGRI